MTDPDRISFAEYVNERITSLDKLFQSRVTALEQATLVAKDEMNRRLDGMNEFRAQLEKQGQNFITRLEHNIVVGEIRSLREEAAMLRGKASQMQANVALVLGVIGIVIGAIALFH